MAIGRIAGQMLYSNLERQGVDLAFDSNLIYLDVNNRRVGINSTNPTDTLTVVGNVNASAYIGISFTATGNVTAGNVNISGNVNSASGYFASDVTVLGNLYTTSGNVYSNAGIFYGDTTTGAGALYAGVPTGYTLLPNVVAQFTTNVNNYSQINTQNINGGTYASTDIVATADDGNDSQYYVDLGINSSTFDNPAYGAYGPHDSYLIADGGNLLLNAESTGKVIKFVVGGYDSSDIVGNISSTTFNILPATDSTSYDNGALVVAGGVGIAGNLNVHGYTSVEHLVVNGGDLTNVNLGNITFSNTTISTTLANGNVTITPAGTGLVYINTNTALSIPFGNTGQEPVSPPPGSIRYNTDISSLEFFNGTSWIATTSTFDTQQINPDGTSQTYTLIRDTDASGILVMLNGVMQLPDVAYTVSADQITFAEVPSVSDIIDIRFVATGELATGDLRAFPDATYINTTPTTIDSYDVTLYRTAKYIVQVSDDANVRYQTSEVLMTHNGSTSTISVYGSVLTSANLAGFTTTISGGYAQLKATSSGANCAVKLQKTYISV